MSHRVAVIESWRALGRVAAARQSHGSRHGRAVGLMDAGASRLSSMYGKHRMFAGDIIVQISAVAMMPALSKEHSQPVSAGSISVTRRPRRWSSAAVAGPMTPAPILATSRIAALHKQFG